MELAKDIFAVLLPGIGLPMLALVCAYGLNNYIFEKKENKEQEPESEEITENGQELRAMVDNHKWDKETVNDTFQSYIKPYEHSKHMEYITNSPHTIKIDIPPEPTPVYVIYTKNVPEGMPFALDLTPEDLEQLGIEMNIIHVQYLGEL